MSIFFSLKEFPWKNCGETIQGRLSSPPPSPLGIHCNFLSYSKSLRISCTALEYNKICTDIGLGWEADDPPWLYLISGSSSLPSISSFRWVAKQALMNTTGFLPPKMQWENVWLWIKIKYEVCGGAFCDGAFCDGALCAAFFSVCLVNGSCAFSQYSIPILHSGNICLWLICTELLLLHQSVWETIHIFA